MQKIYLFPLLAIIFALSACGTVKPVRNHNAVGIPRYVDFDPGFIIEEKPHPLGMSGGVNYGVSFTDSGSPGGSLNILGGPTIRKNIFFGGWQPFHSNSRSTQDDTNNWGSLLFAGVKLPNQKKWAFSAQASYAIASNHTSDNGCDQPFVFFGTAEKCDLAYADVNTKVKELGLTLVVGKNIGKKQFLSLSTSYYRTIFSSSNSYSFDPLNDTLLKGKNANYGASLFYSGALGTEDKAIFLIGAGASSNREFRARGKRKIIPQFDARLIF